MVTDSFRAATSASRSSPAIPATSTARALREYRAALRDAEIAHSRWERQATLLRTPASGVRALLKLRARPTAVFAANDSMAIGALSALREAGVKVPEEIAVAGFDDIPIARHVNPPLTSVHVPIAEFGERATDKLLDALDEQDSARPPQRRSWHHPRDSLLLRPCRPHLGC